LNNGRQGQVPAILVLMFWHPSRDINNVYIVQLHNIHITAFTKRSRGLSAQLAHFQGGNKAHTVVGMSVGAVRGVYIYLQGAWVVARLWPGLPGGRRRFTCAVLRRRVVTLGAAGTGLPRRRVGVQRGGACAVSVARWCLDGGMQDLAGGQTAYCKKKAVSCGHGRRVFFFSLT